MDPVLEDEFQETCETYDASLEVISLSYKWTLKHFSHIETNYEEVFSFQFTANNTVGPIWALSLKTAGRGSDYFSAYLHMRYTRDAQVRAKFKICFLNKDGDKVKIQYHPPHNFESCVAVGFERFIHRNCLHSIINDDTIRIFCEVKYMINEFDFPDQKEIQQHKEIKTKLCQSFKNLFENQLFCDVTLSVDGVEFGAHKSILAARSAVFAAMFEHDMREKMTNHVEINEISPAVFKELLRFIYYGEADNLDDNASGLLAAADMYALKNLKLLCEQKLSDTLTVERSVETFIFADQRNADFLKARTIEFINCHAADVIKTQGWKDLKESKSGLINEILAAMATQERKKCRVCGQF